MRKKHHIDEQAKQAINERYRSGEKVRDLAVAYGVPDANIYQALRGGGTTLRPRTAYGYKRRLTPTEMAALHDKGVSFEEIGRKAGVSSTRAQQIVRAYQGDAYRGRRADSAEDLAYARKWYEEGMSIRRVAEALGDVPYGVARGLLLRSGTQLREQWERAPKPD